ncbi:MAG: OmpH family outer membrane protein [Bacteroidota bacterium]
MKTLSLLFFTLLLCAATTFAQAPKIGFVNSNKIFQELPEAQEAQKKIDAMSKPIQDEIEKRERDLQARIDDYKKKESLMNEAAKKTAQDEILEMEQKYRAYRTEKLGTEGDLARETDKILTPLKTKIIAGIERVAKEEKYTFVFDKTEQVNILLYGDASHDLTFKVIDKLKRGK